MKRLLPLFILLVVLSGSCIRSENNRLLNVSEHLLADMPDSALQILRRMDVPSLGSKEQRGRYALLLSLAQDKCYIDVANDSVARIAVRYYSKTRDIRHQMLSWYILGVVQSNAGNQAGAIVSFLEAESRAEEVADHHYLGLICRHIGELYSKQNDILTAGRYYQQSAAYFNQADERNYAAYSEYAWALACNYLKDQDTRDSLFRIVESYALSASDTYLISQLALSKGSILLLQSEPDIPQSLSLFRQGKRYLGDSITSQQAASLMMAYALNGQPDSAKVYQGKAWELVSSPKDSSILYSSLYWIADHQGRYQASNDYLEKAMAIQNRLLYYQENMTVANAIADYHHLRLEQSQIETKQQRRLIIIAIICVTLFVLWLVMRLRVRQLQNREKDRIIAEREERLQEDLVRFNEILKEAEQLKLARSEMMQKLSTSILGQLQMVKKWSDAYYALTKEEKDPYFFLDDDALQKKQNIIKDFCLSLEKMRNDDPWFHQVESLVDLQQQHIMERVRSACSKKGNQKPIMDESDYRALLLMFAGLPDKSIAFFLDMTYGAVRMRRSRYRLYFRQMAHPDAPFFLQALEG